MQIKPQGGKGVFEGEEEKEYFFQDVGGNGRLHRAFSRAGLTGIRSVRIHAPRCGTRGEVRVSR
ncbi:hypothetical protein BTA30_07705 [Bacillus swezeyi]|uniref:Uncharacterized protein n=1 Tax=Bacillus swezeyi TaxID=1925020 RepID=A0A1R1RZP9_9BACI|nr:hypothetical protein BW143_13840 [Bacillus swezeyi]OMI31474.1 hypothetical protein BTA30_07705 [Bacillus swezeyi]